MEIVGLSFLCIFLFRDVQLLSSRCGPAMPVRLGLYAAILFASLVLIGFTGAGTSRDALITMRSSAVWIVAISLHLLSTALCLTLNRTRRWEFGWLVAVFPSPVTALFLFTVSAAPAGIGLNSPATLRHLAVAIAWTLTIAAVVQLTRQAFDCRFALEFAAWSNSTALILIPIGSLAQ